MEQIILISLILLWGIVAFTLFMMFKLMRRLDTLTSQLGGPGWETLQPGEKLPDFAAETLTGEPVTRESYLGRRTLFVLLAPDCSPCKEKLAYLERIGGTANQYKAKIVIFGLG